MMPEHEGLVTEVLREPGFFRRLKVMPHAQEVVKKLNEHYDIYIATAEWTSQHHFMTNMNGF